MYKTLSETLKGFCGHLECEVCGIKKSLGSAGAKLSTGWPKCCGYTMRWWTENELKNRK